MQWLRIRNWDRWQTYRRDRDPPPWIKVHKCLLQDTDFALLSDSDKGHIMLIWVLGAQRNGLIPGDAAALRRVLGLELDPDLERFQALGFLEFSHDDVIVTPERRQDDVLEAEAESESEAETENTTGKDSGASAPPSPAKPARVPHAAFQELWKTKLPEAQGIREWTTGRQGAWRARWREHPDLGWWETLFDDIRESDFLMGRAEPRNGSKPFLLSVDWLLNPTNLTKILEGRYHR